MRNPPLIGVSGVMIPNDIWDVRGTPLPYLRSIEAAGGLPLILPPGLSEATLHIWLDRIDGLVLMGGPDLDPAHYGEERHPVCGDPVPELDAADVYLARWALERQVPTLAICRGAQVLAVAAGGSLYQDIATALPNALAHSQTEQRFQTVHTVQVQPGSRLHQLMGTEAPAVNSVHHQAVKNLPGRFRALAHAPDGVLEAYEDPAHPFCLAVQWHPEYLTATRPEHAALFAALVTAAAVV